MPAIYLAAHRFSTWISRHIKSYNPKINANLQFYMIRKLTEFAIHFM